MSQTFLQSLSTADVKELTKHCSTDTLMLEIEQLRSERLLTQQEFLTALADIDAYNAERDFEAEYEEYLGYLKSVMIWGFNSAQGVYE